MSSELEVHETEAPRRLPRFAPIRLSAIALALTVAGIVWLGYHYTGEAVEQALGLLAGPAGADQKDGIIQLLSVFVQNMVAITAVGGLVGPIGKLCEH